MLAENPPLASAADLAIPRCVANADEAIAVLRESTPCLVASEPYVGALWLDNGGAYRKSLPAFRLFARTCRLHVPPHHRALCRRPILRAIHWAMSRRLATQFIKFVAIGESDSILDVGCGSGSLALAIADGVSVRSGNGSRSVGGVHSGICKRKRRMSDCGLRSATRRHSSGATRPSTRPYSQLVLNFVADRDTAVREMSRVTETGRRGRGGGMGLQRRQ
jgi:hypothetical protein